MGAGKGAPLEPREYTVVFLDGPFAGRRATVSAMPPAPQALYVLPDGGIVSHDLLVAGSPDAQELARGAYVYWKGPPPLKAGDPQEYMVDSSQRG